MGMRDRKKQETNTEKRNPFRDGPFWGICAGHALTHWYPASMYVLLPYILLAYDFSVTEAGLLLTMKGVFNAIFGLPIGALTDMSRNKNIFLSISLVLIGLPFLFLGFVDQYWLLALLFIVMGIGNEFWHPAAYTTLALRFPKQKGLAFGYHAMASNLGDMLAPVAIGALIAVYSWQDIIYWNFVPGTLFALFILLSLRSTSVPQDTEKESRTEQESKFSAYLAGFKELLQNKAVLFIALLSGIRAMAQSGIMLLLPLYLALEIGINPFWVGVTLGVLQAGGLVAAPIVGKMSDKTGPRKILMPLLSATSVMIVIVSLIRIDWLLIAVVAVLGFFLFAIRPVLQAWAMDSTAASMTGTTTSLLFTIQAVMGAASPLIGGFLAQNYSYSAAFYFLAAVILAGNLVIHLIPKTKAEQRVPAGSQA